MNKIFQKYFLDNLVFRLVAILKASVHYFYQIFLFYVKCSFHSQGIHISVFPYSPLFPRLKVYDVINCLNKNSITHFVWYLEKEKRYDIEILSIDRVLNKEHFYGKVMQKMCTKS